MTFTHYLNNSNIIVHHRQKKSLKHTYLRVLSENSIEVKSNSFFTHNDAIALIQNKRKWIEKMLYKHFKNTLIDDNFFYLGKTYHTNDFEINDVDAFYKSEAQKIILPMVEKYSIIMNVQVNKVSFRKNKSRWGSCSAKNNISLNTQLIKMPIENIQYVVVHELAHIKHKHHQKSFWEEVEKFIPNYKILDGALKQYTCA